jgi:hypothetical protein
MQDISDEAVPWVAAAADPPLDDEMLLRGARPADAILAPPRRVEGVSALAARLSAHAPRLKYGPRAALAAWLVGVAWLVGSHFVGSPRTVVQQESMQTAGTGEAAQIVAEEPHVQNADVEAMRTAQSLDAKEAIGVATGVESAKPNSGPKTEVSVAPADVSGKVPRRKSAEKPSKPRDRFDRLGLEIAALLADPASRSHSAPGARNRAQGGRGDAFDPTQNPTAPGAPRPLGMIAPSAIANDSAQTASGRKTD